MRGESPAFRVWRDAVAAARAEQDGDNPDVIIQLSTGLVRTVRTQWNFEKFA
jgi:hypothetical protein